MKVSTGAPIEVTNWMIATDDKEFLTIFLGDTLVVGEEYYVRINFTGKIRDDGMGLFLSEYNDANGHKE
jgi:hypothetical protein